jgi:AcrR family transcriptional regulator
VGSRTYRSNQREEQARLTRRRVLDAATAVFLEKGFAGSTMRLIAQRAGVALPTVELLFGTKGRLLKAAIDVAIAGDDEPVAVLERSWTEAAARADTVAAFLTVVASVLGSAQQRSAGLVLAVFEAASTDAELADLAAQMTAQRATTAGWIVDEVKRRAPLRAGSTRSEAVDTAWVLMDPAVFDRLTRRRGWTLRRYQRWFASSVARLLTADDAPPAATAAPRSTTSRARTTRTTRRHTR